MTTLIDSMVERAKADKKTIVLPEGHDDRILAAAEETLKQGIANLVILGDAEEINAKATTSKVPKSSIPQLPIRSMNSQASSSNCARRRA